MRYGKSRYSFDSNLLVIMVLVLHSIVNSTMAITYSQDLFKTCTPSTEQNYEFLTLPLPYEVLNATTLSFWNGTLYLTYLDYCTYDVCEFECHSLYPYSLNLTYDLNGTTSLNMGPINMTSDFAVMPQRGQEISWCWQIDQLTCTSHSMFPMSFSKMPNLYIFDGNVMSISNITFSNASLNIEIEHIRNDFSYTDLFFLDNGCIPLADKFVNIEYCSEPYCNTVGGIYPTGYMKILSISNTCVGCLIEPPLLFSGCSSSKRSLTECSDFNCSTAANITYSSATSNDTLIIQAYVIEKSGVLYYNEANITTGAVTPSSDGTETIKIPSEVVVVIACLTGLLYLFGIIAIIMWCFRRRSNPFHQL